jgi:hypothetical protein
MKLGRIWKLPWQYPGICLEGRRENQEKLQPVWQHNVITLIEEYSHKVIVLLYKNVSEVGTTSIFRWKEFLGPLVELLWNLAQVRV